MLITIFLKFYKLHKEIFDVIDSLFSNPISFFILINFNFSLLILFIIIIHYKFELPYKSEITMVITSISDIIKT